MMYEAQVWPDQHPEKEIKKYSDTNYFVIGWMVNQMLSDSRFNNGKIINSDKSEVLFYAQAVDEGTSRRVVIWNATAVIYSPFAKWGLNIGETEYEKAKKGKCSI